jgi:M6 family metalloprotease-like protein
VLLLFFGLPIIAIAQPQIIDRQGYWTIEPFQPGFGLLEPQSHMVYGSDYGGTGLAHFPALPLRGSLVIPVFLVDWSDFNPATDESNHRNPYSVFRGYVRKSPAELEAYLNATNGVASYVAEVSGGQLQVRFRVFPWLVSGDSAYLTNKEPTYYYNIGDQWYADRTRLAKDVLRAAVVDLGVDLTQFDADGNRVLDGFVIVYEGWAGALSGTNLEWTNPTWVDSTTGAGLDNVAALVSPNDPHYARFQSQNILFSRYNNIPEQYAPAGPDALGEFSSLNTWTHELGHLLLGFRDYYYDPTDLGSYALSARSGHPNPYHPAGLEKWLFGKWFPAPVLTNLNRFVLTDHHLRAGQTYGDSESYLYRILINDDSNHYLTLENRYFLPAAQGGSQFNESSPGNHPESGVVIFEVNRYVAGPAQIRRLLPPRCQTNVITEDVGAFQPRDTLDYMTSGGFHVTIGNFSAPGPKVSFDFGTRLYLSFSGGTARLTFHPVPGLNYRVQYSEGVSPANWADLPGTPHNSGVVSDTATSGANKRFYRLLNL